MAYAYVVGRFGALAAGNQVRERGAVPEWQAGALACGALAPWIHASDVFGKYRPVVEYIGYT